MTHSPSMQPLEVRNLIFATGPAVPRYWHGGRRSITRFFDNLSIFFPLGERFFVTSLRAHLYAVAHDPAMLAAARDFCAQEGIHSREHRRYNAMLTEAGLPVAEMEARVDAILRRVQRLPRRWQLSGTCALEHFTALMGHIILEDPRVLEGADPTMAALWRWHAMEENEHKSVAFDVFTAAGGTYPERAGVMLFTTVIFWAKVIEHQVRLMAADGDLRSRDEWAALWRFLFVDPGGMGRLWRMWLAYFRPGFHPADVDSTALLARWREALATRPTT